MRKKLDNSASFLAYTLRCHGCKRYITKLEVMERLSRSDAKLCPGCGGRVIRPSGISWWEELLLWRSWRMFFAIRNGVLPPPSDPKPVMVGPIEDPTPEDQKLYADRLADHKVSHSSLWPDDEPIVKAFHE